MTSEIRVRFAPSPTGYLHVGGLRTALYNYLFAKRQGGKFILRIEDTDQSRKVEGAVDNLIEALRWAGIEYDEGPRKDGPFGPYIQSERLDIYRRHATQLEANDKAYYCFCTAERLEEMRKKFATENVSQSYDRHCRNLPKEDSQRRVEAGERHVVRMKVPLDGELSLVDMVRGKVSFVLNLLDDQVILKSDGFPTYHLAVVVDDHLMQISHVIRGEEWLSSAPKHVLLYQFFGWDLPQFAHLPLLLNPDKSKLSKRQGDVAVEDYRAKGYLKEAIVNFVALLGWNPGDDGEIFSLGQLVKEFSLERVGKTGAVFNLEKLNWFNEQHLRAKSDSELVSMLRNELASSSFAAKHFSDRYLTGVIAAMRERASFVRDFVEKSPYFFEAPTNYDEAIAKNRWNAETPNHLRTLNEEFALLEQLHREAYETALHRVAEKLGLKNAELIHPLRLAVSGMGVGPGLYDMLAVLGKEEVMRRIERAIEQIK
jgi:glutamyl-tRNA synthetase